MVLAAIISSLNMEIGDFHIAHVLWGGLLGAVAAVLLLFIWRGPNVICVGSLLAGIGFGLFIDEVGKFITSGKFITLIRV